MLPTTDQAGVVEYGCVKRLRGEGWGGLCSVHVKPQEFLTRTAAALIISKMADAKDASCAQKSTTSSRRAQRGRFSRNRNGVETLLSYLFWRIAALRSNLTDANLLFFHTS